MVDHGLDAPKDATVLGTNLWDAWRAGRIRRAPNGVYLSLDNGSSEVDHPLTDDYYAAEQRVARAGASGQAIAAHAACPTSLAARSLPRAVTPHIVRSRWRHCGASLLA